MNMNARMFKEMTYKAKNGSSQNFENAEDILQKVKGVILSQMFMKAKCLNIL